jgi:hypothetical protein
VAPLATLRAHPRPAPLVLALALPFIFLHRHYQPSISVGAVDAYLSDVAVLAVVVAGAFSARSARLPRAPVIAWAALAAFVVAGTAWGALHYASYPAGTHTVTAAKWLEYMLLAPATALIVRARDDAVPAAVALVGWSVAATCIGLLQFFGLVGSLDHTKGGGRVPSFLGTHDFAAVSGAALVVALLVLARGSRTTVERRIAIAAGVAGGGGMVLAGAFDALLGIVLAAVAVGFLSAWHDRRRLAAIAAIVVTLAAGVVGIRSQAVADGLKFLGVHGGNGGASENVQSYRQRTLLAYIGGRIFLAHPLLGVGWQGSADEYAYEPYVADAKRRFDQPAEAFPSPAHPWGVQNAYVQSLADFGVLGLPVFLCALLLAAVLAVRRGSGDLQVAGVALTLLALGSWNGFGLVAGIPVAALTWLAAGVAAAAIRGGENDSLTVGG